MPDGIILSDMIDPVIKAQPDIVAVIGKYAQYIIMLKSFILTQPLNQFSLFINYITTCQVGPDGDMVIIDLSGGINVLVGKIIHSI